MTNQQRGVLYVIVCGSGLAPLIYDFIGTAQQAEWDVCVILTPVATRFVDRSRLETMTGHPVRSDYKQPDEPDVLPRADALVVYPATFNTMNKWALGIADTLAVSLLCEYTGLNTPIVAIPVFSGGLDTNPAIKRSIKILKRYGVSVFYHPDVYPPCNDVPPATILETLHASIDR